MQITPTLINLYHVCHRQVWLHAHGIRMEHTSEVVADGKFVHENSYPQRAQRYEELQLGPAKIDYYDAKNKVVHEIKRSNKAEEAHRWQVKYYLWLLEQAGIPGATGLLEYPALRRTETVTLDEEDRPRLQELLQEIEHILVKPQPPERVQKRICKGCSYFDFCWSE
jgi:CRISPR-associated exonuclease Cas4